MPSVLACISKVEEVLTLHQFAQCCDIAALHMQDWIDHLAANMLRTEVTKVIF